MAAIKCDCPIECKGIVATLWATVLILTLLRKKYSSQQDEWELIAMKAKSWMKKQALPSGIIVQDFTLLQSGYPKPSTCSSNPHMYDIFNPSSPISFL